MGSLNPGLTVGLVGGIASGKSAAAKILEELGCIVLDADAEAHQVLQQPDVLVKLKDLFGPAIVGADGKLDRRRIAEMVFGADEASRLKKSQLESIVHPRVRERTLERIRQVAGPKAIIVLDIPLLLEVGWDQYCDRILFLDTPESIRLSRAAERGWTESEFRARESSQVAVDVKRQRADDVIGNGGTVEQLSQRLAELYGHWQSLLSC